MRVWELLEASEYSATLRDVNDWGHIMVVYPDGREDEFRF